MLFLIYTILVILQQYKGISIVVQDPCPTNIQKSATVADMCRTSNATEEKSSGGNNVDSVVLRIMIQQDDCICKVTIENQIQPIYIGLGKYGGFTDSVPGKYGCGLAVEINHIPDMSTGNVTAPLECRDNVDHRNLQLLQNSSLQFKSRIINGTFTRGYCMQIIRDSSSNNTQVLRINCDAPVTTEQTTRQTMQSDSTPHISGRPIGETTITGTKGTNTDTSNVVSPSITTATEPTTSNTINTVNRDNTKSKGIEQTTYIGIGAGSGVALILLVVLVVICLRRKSTQKSGTNGNAKKSYQQEESDDKLPDNVLYVPAGEFDITSDNNSTTDVDTPRYSNKRLSMEGNYSTVDEDMPKASNMRLSIEDNYSTVDADTPRSSNERYSMKGNYSTVEEDIPKFANNRICMNGDYSTVELDEHLERDCSNPENSELRQTQGKQKTTIKPKPKSLCINSEVNNSPDQEIMRITPQIGSDNVYAVLDKSSNNVPTTNGGKGEGTCQPDQTYAVVDKARKHKSSPDETNKKKFEINYGNRV